MQRQTHADEFESAEDLRAFFAECDARAGEGTEPDWEQHPAVIDSSRGRAAADS